MIELKELELKLGTHVWKHISHFNWTYAGSGAFFVIECFCKKWGGNYQ